MNAVARGRLWANLRLMVVDVETTRPPERGPLRIVSIGVVTVRNGQRTARWSASHVNPGCPIDAKSAEIHGLTDALVADAPAFSGVVAPLLALLRPDLSEHTVFVAHNVSFDAPVVREEVARVGETMPELPVLDTMPLMSVAGVVTPDGKRRLPDLCAALGIALTDHHTALVDAEATAEAVIELLNRAADDGHDDLDALLALLGGHTTHTLRFVARFRDAEKPSEAVIPSAHLATHATILPAKPSKQALAAWLKAADECASHRCGGLDDRVAAAEIPPAALLGHLLPRLRTLAAAGQPADTATLLGAMLPMLKQLPPATTGQAKFALRTAAVALDDDLGPLLDPLGRCVSPVSCPACRRGEPCPLDVWRLALAEVVIAEPQAKPSKKPKIHGSFVTASRSEGLDGAYLGLRASGHERLANAALRLVHRQWIQVDQRDKAATLARRALDLGGVDPEIAERHAVALARPGAPDDLAAAIAVCRGILEHRKGSTDDAWDSLAARLAQLGSRAERFRVRYEDERDEDGNLVIKRRHHPATPLRRSPRFHPVAA